MRFTYCPDCGQKLILKEIGDEGQIPYCENCEKPRFDMFSTCVITLVTRDDGHVVLLNQSYLSNQYKVLISGYMKPGESAEFAARREVEEEVGLKLDELRLMRTLWFARADMLMIAFLGHTTDLEFHLSGEVDHAEWVPVEEAVKLVHPPSPGNASRYLVETFLEEWRQKQK